MLTGYGLPRNYDPFSAIYRWLLRLGMRFYYPVAVVGVTLILAIVVRDTFAEDAFRRRLVILLMIGAACGFVLFWRAERLWRRGAGGWLVRFARPDLVLVWSGLIVVAITVGLAAAVRFTGLGAALDHLWLLYLFPLIYLSERATIRAFALLTGLASLLLLALRVIAGYPLSEAVLSPLWLTLLAGSNHYLVRRYIVLERRAELLREIANELSNLADIDAALDTVVEAVARRLRYDRVRLWLAEGGALTVRATWPPRADLGGVDGVAARVCQTRQLERWDDLRRCPYAGQPAAGHAVRALVAAPLLAEGQPVGVLEVLSPREAEFWEFDDEQLARMADSIGLALARSRAVQREAARLRDTLAEVVGRLGDCTSIAEMFAVLADDARTRLSADAVVLYQLAPGTGYPLAPLFAGDLRAPERLREQALSESSVLFRLLARWTAHYSTHAAADPLLARAAAADSFLQREAVASLAFLPLGTRSERVGALFLNYRAPRVFSPLEKLTLEALASLAAEQINRERASWRKYEAFGGVLFGVHGPLTLSADSLRRLVGSAQGALAAEPADAATAAAALANAQKVVRRLEIAAMLTRLSRRDPLDEAGLQDEVRRAAQKIVQFADPPDGRVLVTIAPEADDLPFAVADALYCLALEAVANASFHGGARRLEIDVAVTPTQIRLSVVDNGRGFDRTRVRPGPNGIFEGLDLVRAQFAARGYVDSQPGAGTRLEVVFPRLPEPPAPSPPRRDPQ